MLSWIEEFTNYVEKRPQDFNRNIKNNIRQIKVLLKKKNIVYKEADPIACYKVAKLFKHREGKWAGTPIEFDMIQKYIIACVLGIKYYDKEEKRYLRYFNELDLFVARKWGKDHFIVPVVAFLIAFDKEPNAWCQIVAENIKQSKRTYDVFAKEIENEPLNEIFIERKSEKYIEAKTTNGKIEYLSGRSKGKDGSNPSVALVNEAHEITNFNQYNSLKSGMGARSQPLTIVISSAGITPESLYESLYNRNYEMLTKARLDKNDRIFALMFGIDDTDQVEDDTKWIKANPAMIDNRPTLDFLHTQYNAAKNDMVQLNTFIAKHLNRQIGADINYFDMLSIKNCKKEIIKDDFYDSYAVGGVDLAQTTDFCSASALILKEGKFILLQAYFIASEVLSRNSKIDQRDYAQMLNLGAENDITNNFLIVTDGSYVKPDYVTDWFCKLRDEYKVSFMKIGYDTYSSHGWIPSMETYGFECEGVERNANNKIIKRDYGKLTPVTQVSWDMSEAIRIIKILFDNGKINYDKNNKLLPYCFYNLKIKVNSNNILSPNKIKSIGHIDGAMSLFDCFVAYTRAKEVYKDEISYLFSI